MHTDLTREQVTELFHYDPDTGIFTYLKGNSRKKAGDIVGCPNTSGHLRVRVSGKNYFLHRIAWLYMTGEWPVSDIDHINGNPSDNKFSNIRAVDRRGNLTNIRIRSDNKTGVMGVYFHKSRNYYAVSVSVNRKRKFIGNFDNLFDACCARKSAEIKYGYHANHNRIIPS